MFLISDYYKKKEIATWHYSQFVIFCSFLAILDNDSQFREGSSYIETLQLQYEIKGKKSPMRLKTNDRSNDPCVSTYHCAFPATCTQERNTCHLSHVSSKYPQLAAVPTQSPNPKSGYAFHHRYEMFRIIFNFTEHIHKAYSL